MDNPATTQSNINLVTNLAAGVRLPFFRKGFEDPLLSSSKDMNLLVAVCNLLLNLKIAFKAPVAQSDGTFQSSADIAISNQNMVITLAIAGADGSTGSGVSITDYDPTATYDQFDIVRVQPTNAASTTQPGGTTIPGVYFAKIAITVLGTPPKHPLQSGGENSSWGWISTWPSVETGCDENGNPITQFIDAQASHT